MWMELLLVIVILIAVGWVISRLDEWRTGCQVDDWWNWLLDRREAAMKRQQDIKDFDERYRSAEEEEAERMRQEEGKQK